MEVPSVLKSRHQISPELLKKKGEAHTMMDFGWAWTWLIEWKTWARGELVLGCIWKFYMHIYNENQSQLGRLVEPFWSLFVVIYYVATLLCSLVFHCHVLYYMDADTVNDALNRSTNPQYLSPVFPVREWNKNIEDSVLLPQCLRISLQWSRTKEQ